MPTIGPIDRQRSRVLLKTFAGFPQSTPSPRLRVLDATSWDAFDALDGCVASVCRAQAASAYRALSALGQVSEWIGERSSGDLLPILLLAA